MLRLLERVRQRISPAPTPAPCGSCFISPGRPYEIHVIGTDKVLDTVLCDRCLDVLRPKCPSLEYREPCSS